MVGGGAVGAAVTYLLAREGWTDVQLIERGDLCAATSSQAAGMVGQARPTADRTRLAMAAAELYRTFPATSGYSTDYRESGAIRLALSQRSHDELTQIAATADRVGLPVEFVDHRRLRELCPVLRTLGGAGRAVVADVRLPAAEQPGRRVRPRGARPRRDGDTHCAVTGVDVRDGAVHGLRTDRGDVRTETVVVAAGPWSAAVVRTAGLELPLVPVRHTYFVTEPAGWDADLPCLRIPEVQVYARGESGRLLCGGFERHGTSLDPRTVERSSAAGRHGGLGRAGGFASGLGRFAPGVAGLGVGATFQGWPTFTPDGRFVVGPVSGLPGLVLAAGCNAHGVSGSAGLAMHLVESLRPDPSPYVRSLSPDRFVPRTWAWEDARTRAQSVYEHYYPMPDEDRAH